VGNPQKLYNNVILREMTFLPLKLAPHPPKPKDNHASLELLQLAILNNDDHDSMEEAWHHSNFMRSCPLLHLGLQTIHCLSSQIS
jgi:hypothetical protein